MTFEDFARIHGLIINHVVHNKSVRVPTEDKPSKNNGWYNFLGDVGFVMNWGTMEQPAVWFAKEEPIINPIDPIRAMKRMFSDVNQINDKVRKENAEKSARQKAYRIMKQAKKDTHPYLANKGFPNEKGYVWTDVRKGETYLVIPMSIDKRLVGCQLINSNGDKKFLYGQTTKNAIFTFDAKGMPIFCEGFATAMSVRQVLKASNIKYCIYVCFSASNMKLVARGIEGGLVIADNDANGIGEKTAINIGKRYWMSDTIGQDFNDFHVLNGDFKASQELKKALYGV